jgi:hypothetical protein
MPTRVRKTQRGGNAKLKGILKKLNSFAKEKKIISSALDHFGFKKLGAHARLAGYGARRPRRKAPKRRVVRRKTQRGSGFFGDVWSGIKKAGSYVAKNKLLSKGLALIPNQTVQNLGKAAAQLGLGRRRARRMVQAGGCCGMRGGAIQRAILW